MLALAQDKMGLFFAYYRVGSLTADVAFGYQSTSLKVFISSRRACNSRLCQPNQTYAIKATLTNISFLMMVNRPDRCR